MEFIVFVMTILSPLILLISRLPALKRISTDMSDIMVIFGAFLLPAWAMASWGAFLCVLSYFQRLRAYGYEISDSRKKYDNRLDKLFGSAVNANIRDGKCKAGMVLAVISGFVFVGVMVYAVVSCYRYWGYDELPYFAMGSTAPFYIGWLIAMLVFWRQRRRDKYRDDVEVSVPGDGRKIRKNIEQGLVEIIFFITITIIWILIVDNMINYVMNARIDAGIY